MRTNRRKFLAGASAVSVVGTPHIALGQKKYDDGASDIEIKIGKLKTDSAYGTGFDDNRWAF